MQKNLVSVRGLDVFTSSDVLAKGLNMEHRSVVSLIKSYEYLEQFKNLQKTKHRVYKKEVDIYWLSELQATILISFMKNSAEVIEFKIKLVTEFYKQRQLIQMLLAQQKDPNWNLERQEGKVARRVSTDTIQEFIEYAKAQGSKSADKYYMSITRMQLTGLFLMEQRYPNAREVMSFKQLATTQTADYVIAESLKDSMEKGLHYKECYKEAKKRIDELEKVIPKSPLPAFLAKNED